MGLAFSSRPDAGRRVSGTTGASWIVAATFLALLALSAALVAAFAHSTQVADDLARADERLLVGRYIERNAAQLLAGEELQLTWDDAVRKAPEVADKLWGNLYIGGFFWGSLHADRVFVVSPDGSLVRSWTRGRPDDGAQFATVHSAVATLITRTIADRTVENGAQWRRLQGVSWPFGKDGLPLPRGKDAMIDFGGLPAFLSVSAIVPDHDATLMPGKPNFVALVRVMDQTAIAEMAQGLLLDDARFDKAPPADPARNAIAMRTLSGARVGWLHWKAKPPGPAIIRRTAPLLVTYILFFLGVLVGATMIVRRMHRTTRELVASEAQAQHNALHDAMSGLPNRTQYMQRLRTELSACMDGRAKGDVFVAYIDIDSFKVVNDTLGHHVGDELVRQVALRLRRSLPASDFLSRFGGDEFVLLRRAEGGRAAADVLGLQLMALMRDPFVISGNSLDVTCSCGISWGPEQSEDPGELLRRADIALYRAKQRGRARYRRFTRDMDASVKLRREMEMELRRAIARDELSLAFQPIVGIADGDVRGFEALLRWSHPERGDIRPGMFVPIAEHAGLMIPLGNWVLRNVFTECRDWPDCDISVNLSPLQIMASDFLRTIADITAETGVDPHRIVLEVTEGIMLDRSDHVVSVLRELNRMGFRIALDDFGIGYSSLSYLRSFQFERIKIDRSFVQNIEGDLDAHSILCAIASLGHTLRMKVVAEGVETQVQRHLVRAAGCELVQGHLFWAAMPAHEARALIAGQHELNLRKAG
jgi:diguanylate cyclase (GGDEF)-like protein